MAGPKLTENDMTPDEYNRLYSLVLEWRGHWSVTSIGSCDRESSMMGSTYEECADRLEEALKAGKCPSTAPSPTTAPASTLGEV